MILSKIKKYLFFLAILIIIFYVIFKFKIFYTKQEINVKGMENKDYIVTNKDFLHLEGTVLDSKTFSINSEPVLLNRDYSFSKKIYLYNFLNTYKLESLSKTGIKSEREIKIYKKEK